MDHKFLPNSRKTVYLRHRRFLQRNHAYRKMKAEFDGTAEVGVGPSPYEGEVVHNTAKKLMLCLARTTL